VACGFMLSGVHVVSIGARSGDVPRQNTPYQLRTIPECALHQIMAYVLRYVTYYASCILTGLCVLTHSESTDKSLFRFARRRLKIDESKVPEIRAPARDTV